MNKLSPAKLLAAYDACHITRHELLSLLEEAATRTPPEEIAALLPADVFDEVREETRIPPASPDDCLVIWMGVSEAEMREEAQLLFEGRWRWHRYFHQT
jgi:hypothetical protein